MFILMMLLLGCLISYFLYFLITAFIGVMTKPRKIDEVEVKTHFVVLIPARNEEKVIADVINSLQNQKYPRSLYDIYVILNHCHDQTEYICRQYNVHILHANSTINSKSDALNDAFCSLRSKRFDAYVFFDADNVVDSYFLKNMNDAFQSGYQIAQGWRTAKNPYDNHFSQCYEVYYACQNYYFNHTRMNLNLSAALNGSGFMISKKIIEENGFEIHTFIEDVEYTGICAFRDQRIAFVENAVTYDEQPINFHTSWIQRKRWATGMWQCLHLYFFRFGKQFYYKRRIILFDIMMIYLFPVMQIFSGCLLVLFLCFDFQQIVLLSILSMSIYMLIMIGIAVIALMKSKHCQLSKMISGIIYFPIFMIIWGIIHGICLCKKETVWQPIVHDRSLSKIEKKY